MLCYITSTDIPHSLSTDTHLPVLPHISTSSHGTPHTPLGTASQRHTVNEAVTSPPTYVDSHNKGRSQRSAEDEPPDYYQQTGHVRDGDGRGCGINVKEENMSQYTSSEEIHVAAMEGVKASSMRKLVRDD